MGESRDHGATKEQSLAVESSAGQILFLSPPHKKCSLWQHARSEQSSKLLCLITKMTLWDPQIPSHVLPPMEKFTVVTDARSLQKLREAT